MFQRALERAPGQLGEVAEFISFIDELICTLRTELDQLPARVGGRDLLERRRIEGIVNGTLHRLADIAATKSRELDEAMTNPAGSKPINEENDDDAAD
jgi:hypothetical protein